MTANAQGPGNGGGDGGGAPSDGANGGADGDGHGFDPDAIAGHQVIILAHAVLATLAFAFLFPVGGILIRLGSFRGLWIVHAVIQIFAYLLYIAAFGLGIYIAQHLDVLHGTHPIIGIVLFVLLFFQPFLGTIHHVAFRKHSMRVVWSHGHIWLGRIIITLGIINGGLGLALAQDLQFLRPRRRDIIGYSVAAAIMWLLYVVSIVVGERRRARAARPVPKDAAHDGDMTQHA